MGPQEYADYLNGPTFRDCNFEKDWKVGEPQDVTFVFCPRFTLVPADVSFLQHHLIVVRLTSLYAGMSCELQHGAQSRQEHDLLWRLVFWSRPVLRACLHQQ